jgi:hypothetical protein
MRISTLLLAIAGCMPSEYIADYAMQPASQPLLDGRAATGELRTFIFEGTREVPSLRYADDRLIVDWTVYSWGLNLTVENRTEQPMRVFWSDARLEGDFEVSLVLAEPGSREERSIPQEPTVIPPRERARYRVIPGPPGQWQPLTGAEDRGFWQRQRAMFDLEVDQAIGGHGRDQLAQQAVGRTLRFRLPIEIQGRRHDVVLPALIVGAATRPSYY